MQQQEVNVGQPQAGEAIAAASPEQMEAINE
jgi:hypothetical protein